MDGVDGQAEPACFSDLNLDQVVGSITASRADYSLKPFFHTPLPDVEAVSYRHAVLRDLEKDAVFEADLRAADALGCRWGDSG